MSYYEAATPIIDSRSRFEQKQKPKKRRGNKIISYYGAATLTIHFGNQFKKKSSRGCNKTVPYHGAATSPINLLNRSEKHSTNTGES